MKIFNSIEEINLNVKTAVALGNFDGVHRGHSELIKNTVKYANENGLASAVFSFSNHPQNYILGKSVVKNITSFDEKEAQIAKYDVDYLFSLTYDKSFQTMSPSSFIGDVVLKAFNSVAVFCGFNFHFGKSASGNTDLLKEASAKESFNLHILPAFKVNNNTVSSTMIREMVSSGHVERCPDYLGRFFSLTGEVFRDKGNGRKIGFPTANIILREEMVAPSNGVYATITTVDGKSYKSVSNVGNRPTVGGENALAESHIFDFGDDIYGKEIKIEFVEKIRIETKFSSLNELSVQIAKDKGRAEEILSDF